MALTFSNAVVNNIASGTGWGDVLKNSVVDVYTGSSPGASNAATGTKLVRFTANSGTLTAETRAHCRVTFTGGTLDANDVIDLSVGGMKIGSISGVVGTAATLAANALKTSINNTWSFPDYYAVSAGTTVGGIRYGEVANAANEVFIIGPKNCGNQVNGLSANFANSAGTLANAAYSINGHTANTATNFANATHGGGGTSANGLGVASANALTMSYPASNGTISKSGTWSGNATANGTAGYFRILCNPNYDDGTTNLNANDESRLIMRIDGTIGTSGADMTISNATITALASQTINQFDFTIA